jgi:hypothetical protein
LHFSMKKKFVDDESVVDAASESVIFLGRATTLEKII